jgi:hypothetical protein
MLYLALIHTAIQLPFAIWCVYAKKFRILFLIGSIVPCFLCMGVIFPPLIVTPILFVEIYLFQAKSRQPFYTPVALVSVVLVYGYLGFARWHKIEDWKNKYPMESMVNRVPEPRPQYRNQQLNLSAKGSTGQVEDRMKNELRNVNGYALKELHDHTVSTFVNSPGFGVTRLSGMTEYQLEHGYEEPPVLPQGGWRSPLLELPPDDQGVPTDYLKEKLNTWHIDNLLLFMRAGSFGYARNRREVAGFRSHEFAEAPSKPQPWKMRTVELVGLLIHDKPVVYLSANLPRMSELRTGPYRSIDKFEERGLTELLRGEDYYVREIDGVCYMLGAIRAVKQCQECHGCERGDLLGAFSYALDRDHP